MMPVAHVAIPINLIGRLAVDAQRDAVNAQIAMQQADLHNALAQSQLQAAVAITRSAVTAKPNAWYHRQRAERFRDEGDKLICRMAFWSEIPLIGNRIVSSLADKLELLSGMIELELECA
jgi:hypothetical protein